MLIKWAHTKKLGCEKLKNGQNLSLCQGIVDLWDCNKANNNNNNNNKIIVTPYGDFQG